MYKSKNGVIVEFERFDKSIRFFVDQPEESIQRHHFAGRFYEEEDLNTISKHMTNLKCIIDVGANVGNHTVFLGSRFPDATLFPVELFPEVLSLLRLNLILNPDIKIDGRGLGVGLSSTAQNCGISARFKENRGLVKVDFDAEHKDGRLVSGDELFEDINPDFIKIDVEGHEIEVLKGLEALIKRSRPAIFIEVDDKNAAQFHDWRQENEYQTVETIRRYEVNENFFLLPQ